MARSVEKNKSTFVDGRECFCFGIALLVKYEFSALFPAGKASGLAIPKSTHFLELHYEPLRPKAHSIIHSFRHSLIDNSLIG